jgi:hypothetical protein
MAGTDKGTRTRSGGRRRSSSGGKGGSGKREEKSVVRRGRPTSGRGVKAKHDAPSNRGSRKTNDSRPKMHDGDDKKAGPFTEKGEGRRNNRGEGKPAARAGKGQKIKGKGKAQEKEKPMTAEELNASMDDYWMKSKDKTVASMKLDEDLDDYWAKKGEENAEDAAAAGDDAEEDAQA